jgi:hypothetical protein
MTAYAAGLRVSEVVRLKIADIVSGEFRHGAHVTTSRYRRQIADSHVLDHTATQRVQFGHWGTSCFGLGFNGHNPVREVNSFGQLLIQSQRFISIRFITLGFRGG